MQGEEENINFFLTSSSFSFFLFFFRFYSLTSALRGLKIPACLRECRFRHMRARIYPVGIPTEVCATRLETILLYTPTHLHPYTSCMHPRCGKQLFFGDPMVFHLPGGGVENKDAGVAADYRRRSEVNRLYRGRVCHTAALVIAFRQRLVHEQPELQRAVRRQQLQAPCAAGHRRVAAAAAAAAGWCRCRCAAGDAGVHAANGDGDRSRSGWPLDKHPQLAGAGLGSDDVIHERTSARVQTDGAPVSS